MLAVPAARMEDDLDALVARDEATWRAFAGARVLVTGGTGFVGKWLLESLLHADRRLRLGVRLAVLSRDPEAFARAQPRLAANAALEWIRGDVRDFTPPAGSFTHAVHAATDVADQAQPLETFDVIVRGTERFLEACERCRVRDALLVSSGAVYGRQPLDVPRLREDFAGAPPTTDVATAYGQGKRASEWLALARGPRVRVARCFAFVGPHLPLDRHFAVGNFIADRAAGRPIRLSGDGTPLRSYLYAGDMAHWLWAILARGAPGEAYNVGSDQAVALGDLAQRIAALGDTPVPVQVAGRPVPGRPAERYVPDTTKARMQLGLEPSVALDDALARTLDWARSTMKAA